MYVPPRPSAKDDPLFPARIGALCAAMLVMTQLTAPQMPPLAIALPVGIALGQRGAFNPAKIIGAGLAIPLIAWALSFVFALTREIPWLMVLLAFALNLGGIHLARRNGNPAGMLLTIVVVMLSTMALQHRAMLNIMRDELTSAMLFAVPVLVVLYALLPPKTRRIHLDEVTAPRPDMLPGSVIRAIVLTGFCFWLYAVLPAQDMMLAVAALFPLVFPSPNEMRAEARQRSAGTLLGVLGAGLALAIFTAVPMFVVLLAIFAISGVVFGWLMIHGRAPVLVYQFGLTVLLGVVATALTSASPAQAAISRIALTLGGAMGAVLAIVLLEYLWARLSQHHRPQPA
ncbi:MAG: FUSC family protein [Paracoccus sp. (in: a-proteobacteria)]|nr:FUSC family protein [Paracoccus sp. (in: a-proteobacteria)]